MCKAVLYFLTLYMCYHTVASASTFTFYTNTSLHVYEGEILEICVEGRGVSTSTEVKIIGSVVPNKTSAIAGLDFSPPQLSVQFSRSLTSQTKCGHFVIIEDGLDEEVEYFNFILEPDWGTFDGMQISVSVNACSENDIHLQKIEDEFSMVEYCYNNHWVTLCDYNWTAQDARVTCRQAGYSKEEKAIENTLSTAIKNNLGKVPVCSTNDTQLDECMVMANSSKNCHLVLVKCDNPSTSSSSDSVVAATVPVTLIVVVGASVAAALVIILFVLRKRKHNHKQLDIRRPQNPESPPALRNVPDPFISELASQVQDSFEQRSSRYIKQNDASESTSTKSKHISVPNEAVIENNSLVEYSAPFSPKSKAVPVAHTAGGGVSAQINLQKTISSSTEVVQHEYEGVGSLPMPTAATASGPNVAGSEMPQLSTPNGGQQATAHPFITAGYSQLEAVPEEYSHLQHT